MADKRIPGFMFHEHLKTEFFGFSALSLADEFTFELGYKGSDQRQDLESAVAIQLLRSYRDRSTGHMALIFSIVFAPPKPMRYERFAQFFSSSTWRCTVHCMWWSFVSRHQLSLVVQSSLGGLWRFPLVFIANESNADDLIIVESRGLGVQSTVLFKLFSPVK